MLVEIEQPGYPQARYQAGFIGQVWHNEQFNRDALELSFFEDVVYLEGRHVIIMSPDRYLGAWRSVNDLQVQLGEEKFESFLSFVEQKIAASEVIEATYLTRAWSARKKS